MDRPVCRAGHGTGRQDGQVRFTYGKRGNCGGSRSRLLHETHFRPVPRARVEFVHQYQLTWMDGLKPIGGQAGGRGPFGRQGFVTLNIRPILFNCGRPKQGYRNSGKRHLMGTVGLNSEYDRRHEEANKTCEYRDIQLQQAIHGFYFAKVAFLILSATSARTWLISIGAEF